VKLKLRCGAEASTALAAVDVEWRSSAAEAESKTAEPRIRRKRDLDMIGTSGVIGLKV
jgi:hypothetical protein